MKDESLMMTRKFTVIIIGLLISVAAFGQSHFEPNYALKSPMTLEIINLELTEDATVVRLSIENQAEGGYFCIDRETYLLAESGKKYMLKKLVGLPFCPGQYKFKRIGEIKYITMTFPPIPETTKWVDIIEECGANCLAVYGLSLEPRINTEINICFRDMEQARVHDAIARFESLKTELKGSGNPILGSIYINLITLYNSTGKSEKAGSIKTELKGLVIPYKEKFLNTLQK